VNAALHADLGGGSCLGFGHASANLASDSKYGLPRNASLVLPLEKAQNWHLNEQMLV